MNAQRHKTRMNNQRKETMKESPRPTFGSDAAAIIAEKLHPPFE